MKVLVLMVVLAVPAMAQTQAPAKTKEQQTAETKTRLKKTAEASKALKNTRASTPPTNHPEPIYAPAPQYPLTAKLSGAEGVVKLSALVRSDGTIDPGTIKLMGKGLSRELNAIAADTVKSWRFRPTMKNGQPVDDTAMIRVEFKR